MTRGITIIAALLSSGCVHNQPCGEYRPAYPVELGYVRVRTDSVSGLSTIIVRQENGERIPGPVRIDLNLADGGRRHFDTDSVGLQLSSGPIHIQARATGFRPADTTIVLRETRSTQIAVRLPSLVVATPPLDACR